MLPAWLFSTPKAAFQVLLVYACIPQSMMWRNSTFEEFLNSFLNSSVYCHARLKAINRGIKGNIGGVIA